MEAKPRRRTRERILELSLRLFNELGEPNVTTTTIAEEMEISPGNLYYHFRNKDDIINSIFAHFENEIEKRLHFAERRPTIDEVWHYLKYMADFLWTYRFFYRDLNDLLSRNRTLELHFKQILGHKVRFARDLCEQLVVDGEMQATPAQIGLISTNIGVIATYWLSYQFVMNPRQYNDQDAIRTELHQVSVQILSIMAPYLRGRSRQIFDDIASGTLPLAALRTASAPTSASVPAPASPARTGAPTGNAAVPRRDPADGAAPSPLAPEKSS
ncbi:MAG: TetR/AcrR family transcriptional regulator [Janthinobacterium lividum]